MADYYLKTDNIMKNMFTVALKDELAAQSQMGKVRPATEAMLQKVRDYELSEKRLPITTEEQRELRNALNRLRDKYLAMGRYSDGIDSVILKVMKPTDYTPSKPKLTVSGQKRWLPKLRYKSLPGYCTALLSKPIAIIGWQCLELSSDYGFLT